MATRPSTFPLQRIIFLAVSVVLCVQVGWWCNVQIRESSRLMEARIRALRATRAEAWQLDGLSILSKNQPGSASRAGLLKGHLPNLPDLEQRRKRIQSRYPHVAVVPAPIALDDPALTALDLGHPLVRRLLDQVRDQRRPDGNRLILIKRLAKEEKRA